MEIGGLGSKVKVAVTCNVSKIFVQIAKFKMCHVLSPTICYRIRIYSTGYKFKNEMIQFQDMILLKTKTSPATRIGTYHQLFKPSSWPLGHSTLMKSISLNTYIKFYKLAMLRKFVLCHLMTIYFYLWLITEFEMH